MTSAAVFGRVVGKATGLTPKLKALVRLPATWRRQAEMLPHWTPVTSSANCSGEVWSKVCELTRPPVDQGEITVIGTRGPMPIGSPLTNSSAVPEGAVGGATWSKKPSFSSKL